MKWAIRKRLFGPESIHPESHCRASSFIFFHCCRSRARGTRTGPGAMQIRAFTLIEILITMLISGILILAVTEGLTLFFRLHTARAKAIFEAEQECRGFYRTESLITSADSVVVMDGIESPEMIQTLCLHFDRRTVLLQLRDSILLCIDNTFRDTLLHRVSELNTIGLHAWVDSVVIRIDGKYTVAFVPQGMQRTLYQEAIDEIERDYDYDQL